MPPRDLIARITLFADARRLATLSARRNLDIAERMKPAHLAALDELGVAALEADVSRRQEEEAYLAGLIEVVEAWEREGCPF